jgi:hypothetical protein
MAVAVANAHRWVHRTGGRFEEPTVEHDNEVLVPAFLVDTLVPQGGDGWAAVSGAIEVLLSTYNGERYLPQLLGEHLAPEPRRRGALGQGRRVLRRHVGPLDGLLPGAASAPGS